MATDTLPALPNRRPGKLAGLLIGGLGLLGIIAAMVMDSSNPFSIIIDETVSDWETQGASNCSDVYGNFDAFIPGMRGNGACTRGGFVPGTNVIVVSNYNNSGAGSLYDALKSDSCPKVILFNVGGFFDYTSQANFIRTGTSNTVNCNQWSLVGASAPSNVVIAGRSNRLHGGFNLGAWMQARGSNWTIDHITSTGGGRNDAINLGSNVGEVTTSTNGILLNSNMIWGGDEIVQIYNDSFSRKTVNVLLWQNYIGQGVDGTEGSVLFQNTNRNGTGIRNFLNDSYVRQPYSRADGTYWSNNLAVNPGNVPMAFRPCTGSSPVQPIDANVRMQAINNVTVAGFQGNWTFEADVLLSHNGDTGSCTNFTYHESGNRWRRANGTLVDCDAAGHPCVQNGGWKNNVVESYITGSNEDGPLFPTGHVPETIANTQAAISAYAEKIKNHAGARPLERLAFIETRMQYALNATNGITPIGTYDRTPLGAGGNPTIPEDSANGGNGSSYGVINEGNTNWTAVNQCGGMPTGAAADTIQSSGLTGLHEWVIECFYDAVMPTGYREALTP